MDCFPDAACPCDFQGSTLVVGVPAVGNVGQLGLDLLILHTAAKRCAILESPDVLPVAGRGAFGDPLQGSQAAQFGDGLVTSLEVFRAEKEGAKCFFLQQRGPVVTGRQRAFAKEVAMWIKESGFSQALLLSSVDAGLRTDKQLQSVPICASFQHSPGAEAGLQSVPRAAIAELGTKAQEDRCAPPWPLYNECGRASVRTALLATFAADGDNVPEALLLVSTAAPGLPSGLLDGSTGSSGWCVPASWRCNIEAHLPARLVGA